MFRFDSHFFPLVDCKPPFPHVRLYRRADRRSIAWPERTHGKDYLTQLRAQNPRMYNGGTPMSQAVASGEVSAAGIAAVPTNAKALSALDAPGDDVVPNPGIGTSYGLAALAWSKRPNAARVLADFAKSPGGQAAWHGVGGARAHYGEFPVRLTCLRFRCGTRRPFRRML